MTREHDGQNWKFTQKITFKRVQECLQILINQHENFLIIDFLLFIFKFYTYNFISSGKVNIEYLKTIIYKTRNIELQNRNNKNTKIY